MSRGTEECGRESKGNRRGGLELVRETKVSQSEGVGNRDEKHNVAAGKGLELVRGTKESQSEN